MDEITSHLCEHDFRTLFIEALGWDRASRSLTVQADDRYFDLAVLAEKRGFQIATCRVDRYTLFNRGRLRRIQKEFARSAHEHILISYSDDPAKQVWQWAVRMPDGRRLRHREHPFFSDAPPKLLLARLGQLQFSLADEESTTLIDVLGRVRSALDTRPELTLFVRKPVYAEQSDQLAMAMKDGGEAAFHEFLLFHRPLAKWATKRLRRWPGIDEEDAEQIGMLGVINAARKFKPELGYQFSTYATTAIKRRCHRHGPDDGLLIRVPAPVYWPYWNTQRAADRLDVRRGSGRGKYFIDWLSRRNSKFKVGWPRFRAATQVESIDDRTAPAAWATKLIPDPAGDPCEQLISREQPSIIARALKSLNDDDARIIRLRYGLDQDPLTLEEVGSVFGVTKERIRQRQLKAEKLLADTIQKLYGVLDQATADDTEQRPSPTTEDEDRSIQASDSATVDQSVDPDGEGVGDRSCSRHTEPKPIAARCRSDLVHAS